MRKLIAFIFVLVASPAFGADITATTGWTCVNSSEPTGDVTIDAGSNRKFLMWGVHENNTDPAPVITIGGQAETEEITFFFSPGAVTDHYVYLQIWNESAIGAMSGTTISYTDDTGNFTKAFCYGTVDDTDQANLSSFTGTNTADEGTTFTVTSTSSSGDYVACSGVINTSRTYTSWDTLAEIHDADGGDSWRAGLGAGDGGDTPNTITISDSDTFSGHCLVFPNSAISFTAGPTITAAADGYNIAGTLIGDGTLTAYAIAVNPGAAAPTCTQIQAGDDGSDVAAPVPSSPPGSEVWTTGVGNDFDITLSGAWPQYDVHACGSDGAVDTAVTSSNALNRTEDASQTIYEPSSLASTSPFVLQSENTCDTTDTSDTLTGCADTSWLQRGMLVDLSAGFADLTDIIVLNVTASTIQLEIDANSTTGNITITQALYYSPTVVAGDAIEMDDANSSSGVMSIEADGDLVCSSGTCSGYFTVDYNIQDISDASDGDFDSGPPEWTTGDDVFHVNSSGPVWDDVLPPLIFIKDEAISAEDIGSLCSDVDSQALTIEVRTGSLPTGLSLSGAGVFTGTPTVLADVTLNITCKDTGDLYVAQDQQITVVDTVSPARRRRSSF